MSTSKLLRQASQLGLDLGALGRFANQLEGSAQIRACAAGVAIGGTQPGAQHIGPVPATVGLDSLIDSREGLGTAVGLRIGSGKIEEHRPVALEEAVPIDVELL